jgi:hypothetical protein
VISLDMADKEGLGFYNKSEKIKNIGWDKQIKI